MHDIPPNDNRKIHSNIDRVCGNGSSQIISIPFVASKIELIMSINTGF